MQDESKRLSVSISFGERGTVYGCGHALDTMLYACKLQTEEEALEQVSDMQWDAIRQVLKDWDFEKYQLEHLNKMPTVSKEYLHGDYLRFEEPERFAQYVREDRERIKATVMDQMGDWNVFDVPPALHKELTHAMELAEEYALNEWLKGDRSSQGALGALVEALFGRYTQAKASWEPKTDTVTIEASGEEWREWMGYDLGDDEPLPNVETIGENLKKWALYRASEVKEERNKKTLSRAAEYKRQEEQKAARLEREKEEARQRKAQKDQA